MLRVFPGRTRLNVQRLNAHALQQRPDVLTPDFDACQGQQGRAACASPRMASQDATGQSASSAQDPGLRLALVVNKPWNELLPVLWPGVCLAGGDSGQSSFCTQQAGFGERSF